MTGELYLCATPIGNLEDITLRVLRTLREVDLIAAEDTRNSVKLLNHFDIHTPLTSYHEHNKVEKGKTLIAQCKAGKKIALITDAGTPAISDPGEDLVRLAYEEGVPVTSLPGPAACITALTLSGMPGRRFVFEGFLPQDKKERGFVLRQLEAETRTIVLYEAPHHLTDTLIELEQVLGDRPVSLCRELTKRFETVTLLSLREAIKFTQREEPRGEYVLVIEGISQERQREAQQAAYSDISIAAHMERYLSTGMEKKEAMRMVASDRGISRREVYQALLKE